MATPGFSVISHLLCVCPLQQILCPDRLPVCCVPTPRLLEVREVLGDMESYSSLLK